MKKPTKKAAKKKPVKKAAKKKVVKKKVAPKKRAPSKEVVVRVKVEQPKVQDKSVLDPIKDGGKYMIPKTWMSEKQVVRMLQRTPPQHVHQRPGKGGGQFDYVTGTYVKKVLNFTFGWLWDFEIVSEQVVGEIKDKAAQIVVRGKLTVKDDKDRTISKTQYGGAEVKYKTSVVGGKKVRTSEPLDIGNDFKAAATDCLKKCAAELGIASDIYGKGEFKDLGQDIKDFETDNTGALPPGNTTHRASMPQEVKDNGAKSGDVVHVEPIVIEEVDCHGVGKGGCPHGAAINRTASEYAIKIYGKPLCGECQKEAKPIKK